MNHFYTSALKLRVWNEDQWSRLLIIYYFLDLDKEHLGIDLFQLATTVDRPHIPFGRVLTFREQLLSSDFATHVVDYHGEPILEIIDRKIAEVYPSWNQDLEPVDLNVTEKNANN